jgi:hypothetical protein
MAEVQSFVVDAPSSLALLWFGIFLRCWISMLNITDNL